MDLAAYLDRIGFSGRPAVDRATLDSIQQLHLLSIPYENLDVQLGRPRTIDPAGAFDKIVTRRRGGWCYEMNGLMGAALAEIGFPVRRLASGVMRSMAGDGNIGNHLVLRIDLDEMPILADVGLGDGPFTPYAMIEGPFSQGGLDYRLERLEGDWWRLHNHSLARPPNFDLHLEHADEARLASHCQWLQTSPESMFVQTLICQRFTPEDHVDLIGRVLRRYGPAGVSERLLESADELVALLGDVFGIDEPAAAGLWPRICARHEAVFAESRAASH
jgi:N-hydroxyarylamine O-acetyltransferase